MKKGTYVSRAVYAKLQAENKRLLSDLKTISTGAPVDSFFVIQRWRKHFREENILIELIKEAGKKYLDEHPEEKAFIESLKNRKGNKIISEALKERKN